MATRSKGSGSKREKRPGVWELRAAGQSVTVKGTSKEAEKALAALVARTTNRHVPEYGRTLDELLVRWLGSARLERATVESYTAALAHLPPTFRRAKLQRLSIADFEQLYRQLERQGIGAQTIRKLHTALGSALSDAVRWRWLDTHPARGARLPTIPDRNVADIDEEILATILAVAGRDDVQAGLWVRLALCTGIRRSELLALRWADIDLKNETVTVSWSLERDRTLKSTTKTRKARTFPIDPGTVAELRRWKAAEAERALAVGVPLPKNPYVLSNAVDSSAPWRPDGASQRFRRLCARAGVEGVRLHDLRHAHASMLLRDGVDLATVSERLGHSRRSTTLDTYDHIIAGTKRAAAESMSRRFG